MGTLPTGRGSAAALPGPMGGSASGLAFSIKEIRRAALGLRRPEKGTAEAAEVDELESVERELGVGDRSARSPVKRRSEVKLPESLEMLCEFFNCLLNSTRLLRMKGSKTTFPNICASIQNLSERRFTYSHLAQLKYIIPEAIVVNKILLRDDRTCCMKPDLQVNLLVGTIEGVAKDEGETAYSALRKLFRQRLLDFFRGHPEGDDVPEYELPHPFNRTRSSVLQAVSHIVTESTTPIESSDPNGQQIASMSHMSQSFKRRFSQKSPVCSATASSPSALAKVKSTIPSPSSRNSNFIGDVSGNLLIGDKLIVKVQESEGHKDVICKSGVFEGTPAKFASTPVRLMASTPDLKTPKRPISATATGYDTPPQKFTKRSARAKLFTTPTKGGSSMDAENQSACTSACDDDELLSFLPKSLLQSVKEKEQKVLEEKETGFVDQVKRQKLIASLPSTFDIIFLIYQSRQRSVMTKQELIHKIIASSPKIVDRSEIEGQLTMLEELVPDWISKKTALSGDVLCCVDAALSQAGIRQRLYGAE